MKVETVYTGSGKYTGRTMCGFESDKDYEIKIVKDVYGYTLEDVNHSSAAINYASEGSLRRNWILENNSF